MKSLAPALYRSALALVVTLAAHSYVHASGGGEAPAHADSTAVEPVHRIDILDLDKFRIRACRPTDQEVVDINFGVCLVLSSKTTEEDYERLAGWKNRLRDQVIIAVRGLEPADFADPQLRRLQRMILFRVKRLPTEVGIIGIYLTDFSLDEGQTVQDMFVPTITPSAPAPKPSGGGH